MKLIDLTQSFSFKANDETYVGDGDYALRETPDFTPSYGDVWHAPGVSDFEHIPRR